MNEVFNVDLIGTYGCREVVDCLVGNVPQFTALLCNSLEDVQSMTVERVAQDTNVISYCTKQSLWEPVRNLLSHLGSFDPVFRDTVQYRTDRWEFKATAPGPQVFEVLGAVTVHPAPWGAQLTYHVTITPCAWFAPMFKLFKLDKYIVGTLRKSCAKLPEVFVKFQSTSQ
jgi:hypothetical protein